MDAPASVASNDGRTSEPVFISYASADRREALSVCKAIERRGPKCWISCRDVEPGENYQEAIVTAIQCARAMVLVFSDAANNSNEIKKELSLASRFGVVVIALRIEDVEPSKAFAYELSTRQWIDAFEGWDQSIDALIAKLQQIACAELQTTRTSLAQVDRRSRIGSRWQRRTIVGSAVALLLIAGGGLLMWKVFAAPEPLTVEIGNFQALGVPADTTAAFQQELRAAFGDDNMVEVKDSGATFALSGSIRNMGDSTQYAAQLTDTRTGEMVWSGMLTATAEAGALAPKQKAAGIVWVIRCGLAGAMDYRRKLPIRALALYLQHCELDDWGGREPNRSLDLMKQVVQLAPDFSKGWSQLAIDAATAASGSTGDARSSLLATGNDAVQQALKIDPRNGNAYMAAALLQPPTAWIKQEDLLRKAVTVKESDCGCEHETYGELLLNLGRPTEAAAQYRRGVDMQPSSQSANMGLMRANYVKGDRAAGDRVATALIAFWRGTLAAKHVALIQAEEDQSWVDAAKAAQAVYPDASEAPLIEGFSALASREPTRMAMARQAIIKMPDDDRDTGDRAIILSQLGAPEDAVAILEPLYARAAADPAFLLDPLLASLRTQQGWVEFLKRAGLINYWRTSKKAPELCRTGGPPPVCRMM